MKKVFTPLAMFVASALLSGCSFNGLIVERSEVQNKTWVLASMNGNPATDQRVTLELLPETVKQGSFMGRAQCNIYSGLYSITDNELAKTSTMNISQIEAANKNCSEQTMDAESTFLGAFPKMTSITVDPHAVVLSNPENKDSMVFIPESVVVNGTIKASGGKFATGTEIIVVLQDSSRVGDPAGIIGAEAILVEQDADKVDYAIRYAPELVDPEANYTLQAEAIHNGQVMFVTSLAPRLDVASKSSVSLLETDDKHSNKAEGSR